MTKKRIVRKKASRKLNMDSLFSDIPKLYSQSFKTRSLKLKDRGTKYYRKVTRVVERRPILSLLTLLGLLFLLIAVGSFLRKPEQQKTAPKAVKNVNVFSIGQAPRVTIQAQIEKTGIIQIVALSGGIVNEVLVTTGEEITKGTQIATLSTSYSGGNPATVQRQIAGLTYQNAKDTYDSQKDIINKQREIALKSDENSEEIREITRLSINETQATINLNQQIANTLKTTLQNLENNNTNGTNNQLILSTQQMLSQVQGGVDQLNSAVRNAEYQAGNNNPPTILGQLQKDIALKQLDIQEKALKLSLEISGLQIRLAQISEAAFSPTAPFTGTVERIHVVPGQSVQPGTPLITLHGDQTIKIVAKIPRDLATNISRVESSTIFIDKSNKLQLVPIFVSSEATDGNLYSVLYDIPSEFQNALTNRAYIPVEIPVGYANTNATIPFVPIDAVYQSQTNSYLFIAKNGKAVSQEIELGEVIGQYVEVLSGLKSGDEIILDRTVINNDPIKKI